MKIDRSRSGDPRPADPCQAYPLPMKLLVAAVFSVLPASLLAQSLVSYPGTNIPTNTAPTSQEPVFQVPAAQPNPSQDQPKSGANAPQSVMSPEDRADLFLARREYQSAIQAYKQLTPKNANIWNKIGIANQQMYITDEAKRDYETALKLDPKDPDVLNNLASVYYSLKEYSSAERLYRKALKIKPKSAIYYKNLGTDLLAADKFKKGWECYQAALSIDPQVFERNGMLKIGEPTPAQKRGAMNYYLAKSYVHVGDAARAVDYLRMAVDEGFTDRKRLMGDKEFASLHGFSAFEQLLSEQRRVQ